MKSRRLLVLSIAAASSFCTSLYLYVFNPSRLSYGIGATVWTTSDNGCVVDFDALRAYGLDGVEVEYSRLEIAVAQSDGDTFSTHIDVSLPAFQLVSLDSAERQKKLPAKMCSPSVTMRVPMSPAKPDASHIIFGVATTLERLNASLDAFSHWASGTNTKIIAIIEPHPNPSHLVERASDLGFKLTIIESDEDFLERYFSLVQVLFTHREERTRWVGLIDDDTFFPSMSNLVSRLSSYDTTKSLYIGAVTEDMAQMYQWGYMAYGGAGIFLSIPLLRELNNVYDECKAIRDSGDRKVATCIYDHTSAKLSWEQGLHQLDLDGDPSGFYESGRPLPLSLHHWKSWHQVDMVGLSALSSVCGEACMLRRWRLSDGWFLVNGFSLVKYSSPLMPGDFSMEQTWQNSVYGRPDGFAHSLAPLRPRDEGKISFRVRGTIRDEQSHVVQQFYVHKPPDDTGDPDQVLEVVWRPLSN
jgi:hypothetical protein